MELLLLFGSLLILAPSALADGLYSKNSPVLQLDARSYEKLIAKSNYTSIVEFYAPWCGHCKNLKPAYEKAATSLAGYAKVAAVNCDDDSNKAFCGSMGVQGFPTLKIVKPKKKGGRPTVEDYQGARTAAAISEAIVEKIPNHVTKVTDGSLDQWLKSSDRPKAVFFTEKGSVSPLVKSIAIDFLGVMDVAQVRSAEKSVVDRFMVTQFPRLYFMASADHVPDQYAGDMKKVPLMEFFKGTGLVTPNPEFPIDQTKPAGKKPEKKKAPKPSSAKSMPEAASETLKNEGPPTESPGPIVEDDGHIQVPVVPAADLQALESENALQKSCLNTKSGTCVLAILTAGADKDSSGLTSLGEIAHKHVQRRAKLFPMYAIPESNAAGKSFVKTLGIKESSAASVIIAVNAKRGWWSQYTGGETSQTAIESWIDGIRFGDFKKEKLPDGVVTEAVKAAEQEAGQESIKINVEQPKIKVEKVEHQEL